MMKRTKWIAMLCALSMMTMAAGCGSEETSSESAAEITSAAIEAATEAEESEAETEASEELSESAEDDTDASSEEDEEASAGIDEIVDNGVIDTEASCGSMSYSYSSSWIASEAESQVSYQLPDGTGAIILQYTDGSTSGLATEEEMIEALAEQSETAWNALEDMEVLESEWNEEILPGKKCYVVTYSYEVASIMTLNTTVFFANYTDTAQDVFAVTCTALTEDSSVADCTDELLSTITFSES